VLLKSVSGDAEPEAMSRSLRLPLLSFLAALAASVLAAPAAHASWKAPCLEGGKGPKCIFWNAKAKFIADGDTIKAVVADDPTRTLQLIRFNGINAMELHRYSKYRNRRRGDCHGTDAAAFVGRYVRRSSWKVRLAAQRASSRTGGRHRLRRSVWVKVGGRWRDLARLEMEAGLALWLPNDVEWAHNLEYHQLAEQAVAAQRGLYDPGSCKAGPDQDLPISLTINWDADGGDNANRNDEWVDIHNAGLRPLSLKGWWFRDSWLRFNRPGIPGFEFPPSTVIPPSGTLRLRMGCGANAPLDLHWCQPASIFENVSNGQRNIGDGGYLFDPNGDVRASQMYPCVYACVDPLAGKVNVDVHYSTPELITIANTSAAPIDLAGHVLRLHYVGHKDSYIFGYAFRAGTILQPRESMLIHPGGSRGDRDTMRERYLHRGFYVLSDNGGVVSLRTATDMVTDCFSWGRGHC
jgi:endonuclease YncB( thermonuclease family)